MAWINLRSSCSDPPELYRRWCAAEWIVVELDGVEIESGVILANEEEGFIECIIVPETVTVEGDVLTEVRRGKVRLRYEPRALFPAMED